MGPRICISEKLPDAALLFRVDPILGTVGTEGGKKASVQREMNCVVLFIHVISTQCLRNVRHLLSTFTILNTSM